VLENWLHITISSPNLRYYYDTQLGNASNPLSWSSFAPMPDLCSKTLSSASLDPFAPSDFIPCSLNNRAGIYDLANSEVPYTMLEIGISPVNDSFYQQIGKSFSTKTKLIKPLTITLMVAPLTKLLHILTRIATEPMRFSFVSLEVTKSTAMRLPTTDWTLLPKLLPCLQSAHLSVKLVNFSTQPIPRPITSRYPILALQCFPAI